MVDKKNTKKKETEKSGVSGMVSFFIAIAVVVLIFSVIFAIYKDNQRQKTYSYCVAYRWSSFVDDYKRNWDQMRSYNPRLGEVSYPDGLFEENAKMLCREEINEMNPSDYTKARNRYDRRDSYKERDMNWYLDRLK